MEIFARKIPGNITPVSSSLRYLLKSLDKGIERLLNAISPIPAFCISHCNSKQTARLRKDRKFMLQDGEIPSLLSVQRLHARMEEQDRVSLYSNYTTQALIFPSQRCARDRQDREFHVP